MHTPNPDGTVTVTRDSPWDDDEREAQHAYDELVCDRCGNLRSVCHNPDIEWFPQRDMCYPTADLEVARRRLAAKHEKNKPGSKPHPLDGMRVWMSQHDLTPSDSFL